MTDNNHPITPPSELMQQWWDGTHGALYEFEAVVTQAARWGADQELEACCVWLSREVKTFSATAHLEAQRRSDNLRTARRYKPPSLKEQALQELDLLTADATTHGLGFDASAIRRALESLPS